MADGTKQRVDLALDELLVDTQKLYELAAEAEDRLNTLKRTNAEHLKNLITDNISAEYREKVRQEKAFHKASEILIKQGYSAESILTGKKYAAELTEAKKLKKEIAKLNPKSDQAKELKKQYEEKLKAHKEWLKKASKEEKEAFQENLKAQRSAKYLAAKEEDPLKEQSRKTFEKSKLFGAGVQAYDQARAAGATGGQAAFLAGVNQLMNWAKALESDMKSVANAQTEIDTRLQGSSKDKSWSGSYWQKMSETITQNVGVSPFVKQEKVVENLKSLVGQGISFNVEQRAFLQTVSEKIATTFNATDAALLKLVRIQQADTTAARLGMESALTSFLNNMYETTEYMQQAATEIRGNLYEASALMDAESATEFEYEVQKWMGSLYSVGFNKTSGLSGALGKLAAGDISGITEGGYGNLLVMAANKANLSIADILAEGLNDDSTSALLKAMVEYLSGIYEETKNNKVISQQFANVYGLTASDLKAAANLAGSTQNIYSNKMTYSNMLTQLNTMADSMWQRTSVGGMMDNLMENFQYTMAASMGNNPVLYSLYSMGNMLRDLTGGISIPAIGAWAMGNGSEVNLNATVADLMQAGAMSGGILSGIGQLVAGLAKGSGGGFSGSGMLKAFGINTSGTSTVTRGNGLVSSTATSGNDTSLSGLIGNASGEDIKNKTLTDANDDADKQVAQALEELNETTISNVDEHVVQIYTILSDVVAGTKKLHVTYTSDSAWSSNGFSTNGVPTL